MKEINFTNRSKNIGVLFLILILIAGFSTLSLGQTKKADETFTPPIPFEITRYSEDWPLANRDYKNTRKALNAEITSDNVANLEQAWSFTIPGIGESGGGTSNPLIIDDTVYFQDLKANVFAIDFATGEVKWKKMYDAKNVAGPNGPAVGWGKVFVAKEKFTIAALDKESGEELWANKISDVETTGIDIQPSVYDGMVYVSTVPGTGDKFYAPGGMGIIHALDQRTGEIEWTFNTVKSPDLWGHPDVNSGGGAWYTPAVDTDTGTTFWGIGNPAPFPGTEQYPSGSSFGDALYTDSLVALDHESGNLDWFNQVNPHDILDHDLQIPPILGTVEANGEEHKAVFGAGKMGKVFAFDRETGELLWTSSVGKHMNDNLDRLPEGTTRIYPGVLGGVEVPMSYDPQEEILFVPVLDLYTDWTPTSLKKMQPFGEGKGRIVALEANRGKPLWTHKFDSLNLGATTVVNDLVLTATFDGKIHAFDKLTGEKVWEHQAPAGINGWPAVSGDTIVWPAGLGENPSLIALRLSGKAEGKEKSEMAEPKEETESEEMESRETTTEVKLAAKGIAFDKEEIVVPAGEEITLIFDNQDAGVPHNVAIYETEETDNVIFQGETFPGVEKRTYTFTAPEDPGGYFFRCDVHPKSMTGTMVVKDK